MMTSPKVAFVYPKDHYGLTGNYYINNPYRFFLKELPRQGGDVCSTPTPLDITALDEYDALIFYSLQGYPDSMMPLLQALHLNCYRIVRTPDGVDIDKQWNERFLEHNFDLAINHQSPNHVRQYLDPRIPYQQVIFGIDPKVYYRPRWSTRRSDKVLLSGGMSGPELDLRRQCRGLQGVEYVPPQDENNGDKYGHLLAKYKAGIAANSEFVVYKYFELPCSGMLTFIEATLENQAVELGFEDGVNCIFIDQDNAQDRITEFLKDPDNRRWEMIAIRGRQLILENYSNRKQVRKLLEMIP